MCHKLSKKAFTLPELMIVILITGILSVYGYTSYRASQEYARFYNVVVEVMKAIRTSRNLAINSQIIGTQTPLYFFTQLSLSSGIKAEVYGRAEEPSSSSDQLLSQYNYQSSNQYVLQAFNKAGAAVPLPVKIKFSPPFGDVLMTDQSSTEQKKIKLVIKTVSDKYCATLSINKVSGLLSVEKAGACP